MKTVKNAYAKAKIFVLDFEKNDIVTASGNGFKGSEQPFGADLETVDSIKIDG